MKRTGKRTILLLLTLCLALGAAVMLSGCGEDTPAPDTAQTQPDTPAPTSEAAPQTPAAEEPAPEQTKQPPVEEAEEQPPQEPEEPAEETQSALEIALSFVAQDASGLLEVLGEPLEKSYEESCSGPGDDGIWIYDGLTVFTYTEDGVETVVDAE